MRTSTVSREWPKEVAEFAAKHGVEHCLSAVLEMTRRLFPDTRRLEVCLEADWEIAGQLYIVLEVVVAGWDVARAAAARHHWIEGAAPVLPVSPTRPICARLGAGQR